VAKRIICDHVTSVGGLQSIDASDKHLLLAASSARQKYLSYIEDEKKKKECSGRGQKRKLLNDEIDELQKKKRCLQTDIDSLTASADEYAEKLSRHTRCHGLPSLTTPFPQIDIIGAMVIV